MEDMITDSTFFPLSTELFCWNLLGSDFYNDCSSLKMLSANSIRVLTHWSMEKNLESYVSVLFPTTSYNSGKPRLLKDYRYSYAILC